MQPTIYAGAMRTSLLLSLALAGLLLALSGCGGGDDGKISSKADYIAAGDRICADRDQRSLKLAKSTHGNLATVTLQLADIYADAISRLKAIPLPPAPARTGAAEFRTEVDALTTPVGRMKTSALAVSAAVKTKRASTVEKSVQQLQINVNTVQVITDSTDQAARNYGFKTCGQQQQPTPAG
jgi:hypothetical protein